MTSRAAEPLAYLAFVAILLVASAIRPYEYATWLMEVAPILIAAPVLVLTFRRFPLTPLAYRLIFLHAIILMVGGHYTYARVPVGFMAQDLLDLARNPYDRLGHFAQGFVPAILAREILLRLTPLRPGKMLVFLVLSICLAISAAYELVEFAAAMSLGESATEFLGTQGDVWDTQWDMLIALIGAIAALVFLTRPHDRELIRTADLSERGDVLPAE